MDQIKSDVDCDTFRPRLGSLIRRGKSDKTPSSFRRNLTNFFDNRIELFIADFFLFRFFNLE